MTRHDDREWIFSERLADVARETAIAKPLGDLTIGPCFAGRDGARDLVNTTIEVGHGFGIQRHVAELSVLAPEQRDDVRYRALHLCGRRRFAGERKRPEQPARVAPALSSGTCTPTMPRSLQTMPQQPIAVSKTAKPNA